MVADHNTDERGQLILIAAIIVAIAILGGIVLLNTIHASPDVSAQTDAQSVSDTDRVSQQIHADLHALFIAAGSDETEANVQIPWAPDQPGQSGLEEALGDYGDEYTNIVSTNKSAIATVEYDGGEDGAVAYGNESTDEFVDGDPDWLIEGADALPRLYLDIADPDEGLTIVINESDSTTDDLEIDVDDTGVTDAIDCGGETPTEIDLVYGAGEIKTDGQYCAIDGIDQFEDFDDYNVRFEFTGNPDGMYYISGVNADDCAEPCEEGIVNPTFDITYQDPNIDYDGTYTLYEEGKR